MSLFSLIFALLLEQSHPLTSRKYLLVWLTCYVNFFQRHLNAGEHKHGQMAWLLAMSLPLCGVVVLYCLSTLVHPVFAWAFSVLVLYLTMGFRQINHYFTGIQQALRDNDLEMARNILSTWRRIPCDELNDEEIARVAIEEGLLAAHRHVFGVIVWFMLTMLLGLGPVGAVLYRLAQFISPCWDKQNDAEYSKFGVFARQAYHWIEWFPQRFTATIFAIVGDFEDAVYCWRTQAQTWPDSEAGIVLASGAGAIGVRLGLPILQDGLPVDRPELGVRGGEDVDFMQSAIGLVWRTLVFWIVLLILLELVTLVGT